MLLDRVLLKLKAWLAFTLVTFFDYFVRENFPLSDLSLLVLTIIGILVIGVLVLRN
ncbi:uncharacterized protein K444DRAFT_618354 [Hyaloscypha bicolor E]|jgi:hypothetical protein|uniref:Uncharacterized protein n=1 Tax=Hyaloscypha bicolor E TaxID=1095630 RepID=A0A2J6ST14_9HELO|nr:uncharacterized protein K444DRAFT_618354 [Hyaloscypha bicolor E]PMD53879.1 hypothetical protein K444DRAFT_618354 [Hyaloscypha bicolor E]